MKEIKFLDYDVPESFPKKVHCCFIKSLDFNIPASLRNWSILENMLQKKLIKMNQTHSNIILDIDNKDHNITPSCDGILTKSNNVALCVKTADCIPIFITNSKGDYVVAIHSGYQGTLNGINDLAIKLLCNKGENDLMAIFGPSIHQKDYEVGTDIYEKFLAYDKDSKDFFVNHKSKYLLDHRGYVKYKYEKYGVKVHDVNVNTYGNSDLFSYRYSNHHGINNQLRFLSVGFIE